MFVEAAIIGANKVWHRRNCDLLARARRQIVHWARVQFQLACDSRVVEPTALVTSGSILNPRVKRFAESQPIKQNSEP
jgi:hypothetical protein